MNDSEQLAVVRIGTRTRALRWALAWAVLFTLLHVYWYLGGRIGLGDAANPLPDRPAGLGAWILTVVVALMFVLGIAVPIASLRDTGHGVLRRLLVASLWTGCLILLARGSSGLIDDAVRTLGISSTGITRLSYQDILGTAHPSTYMLISGATIDAYFLLGGIFYGWAARSCKRPTIMEPIHTPARTP